LIIIILQVHVVFPSLEPCLRTLVSKHTRDSVTIRLYKNINQITKEVDTIKITYSLPTIKLAELRYSSTQANLNVNDLSHALAWESPVHNPKMTNYLSVGPEAS
jgi:hypothetical protein